MVDMLKGITLRGMIDDNKDMCGTYLNPYNPDATIKEYEFELENLLVGVAKTWYEDRIKSNSELEYIQLSTLLKKVKLRE